jgi:hypothetical protein
MSAISECGIAVGMEIGETEVPGSKPAAVWLTVSLLYSINFLILYLSGYIGI